MGGKIGKLNHPSHRLDSFPERTDVDDDDDDDVDILAAANSSTSASVSLSGYFGQFGRVLLRALRSVDTVALQDGRGQVD